MEITCYFFSLSNAIFIGFQLDLTQAYLENSSVFCFCFSHGKLLYMSFGRTRSGIMVLNFG